MPAAPFRCQTGNHVCPAKGHLWVPAGIAVPREITITNGGVTPEKIASVHLPPAPFTVTGVPRVGTVLAPGQSFVASVTFTPRTAGLTYSDTLPVGTGS
jgi:hypothetical protein